MSSKKPKKEFVFFVDVDNTLLDNDLVKREIRKSLAKVLGESEAHHFWLHHESFRMEKKYVDFPAIVHDYCHEQHRETCDIKVSAIFRNIDFKKAVFPKVSEVLRKLRKIGRVVIFTEGDLVYQKRKVEQSGLKAMSDEFPLGHRKLDIAESARKKYSGKRLVFVDDKQKVLQDVKRMIPSAKTVHVRQGHYGKMKSGFKADVSLGRISELGDIRSI